MKRFLLSGVLKRIKTETDIVFDEDGDLWTDESRIARNCRMRPDVEASLFTGGLAMRRIIVATSLMVAALAVTGCGQTIKQKAATGAIAGAVVGGPIGAAVGGAAGAAVGQAQKPN